MGAPVRAREGNHGEHGEHGGVGGTWGGRTGRFPTPVLAGSGSEGVLSAGLLDGTPSERGASIWEGVDDRQSADRVIHEAAYGQMRKKSLLKSHSVDCINHYCYCINHKSIELRRFISGGKG